MRPTAAFTVALVLAIGCSRPRVAEPHVVRDANCPEVRRVETPLKNVSAEHETLDYWLDRAQRYGPLDEPLLDPAEVTRHNRALAVSQDGEALGQVDLMAPLDASVLGSQVEERLDYMRERLEEGALVDSDGNALDAKALAAFTAPPGLTFDSSWRTVERLVPIRCGPAARGLFHPPVDAEFDRNRCSTMRPGEVVQLLADWGGGLYLARTPYALGWVTLDDLSEPLSADAAAAISVAPAKALTRRALLTEAFSLQGAPYGWGGKAGGYDCSRFLMELFARFGLKLPRHSARQAEAGTFAIDVSDMTDLNEKRLLLDAAAERGIVLLQFPGHIMLYLGSTDAGVPMAIHAFSEYVTPCEGTELETVNRIDRIAVSDLSLGAGSSRGDFLERITQVSVIGRTPGEGLRANAVVRPAAPVSVPTGACRDSRRDALLIAPRKPNTSQPLRVVATSERDPGVATLTLFDPSGSQASATELELDGPPFGRVASLPSPAAGKWTAVLGDGERILACRRFRVATSEPQSKPRGAMEPAWPTEQRWSVRTENQYAAFVENLFREPVDEDVTWPTLQEVIGDPERNLLYDYNLPGEDARLTLEPDCADLPYFLRAYFAWKLRLPFAYRGCSRGRKDKPPACELGFFSNLEPIKAATDTGAFRRFIRGVANVVHSSSPRTLPNDDATDFYPVGLSRDALRPGTVFADPYGHVLVVARWKPQGLTDYGVLIGADAQPDGTVGRRRFWRGSFLFTPDTDAVGAGFKAWRPVVVDPSGNGVDDGPAIIAASNSDLDKPRLSRAWSDEQYRGTSDDFYSAMEGLINPRPLDPVRMQVSLVDALEESTQRRLSSVDNGEVFMKETGFETVPMPRGSSLFLTSGPWEDYSTPSRDMRLLISIDAVTSFPSQVASHPERFGVRDTDRDQVVAEVTRALDETLRARTFEYTRSDGSPWQLTLGDLVDRAEQMEVAYNPNDCVEVRWGAAEGSDERSTCARHAPTEQHQRMQKVRAWFAARKRPQ